MKPLDERIADRKQRKLENQGPEAVQADAEKGLALAGVGFEAPGGTAAAAANNGGGGGWPTGEEGGEAADPLKSIPILTAHLETVTDPAEVTRLAEAEKAGQNRAGALSALDARYAALQPPTA